MNIRYGWYSETQSALTGSLLYKTPDGQTVEVTEVTTKKTKFSNWDDIIFVGEVCQFIRQNKRPPLNFYKNGI